VDGAPGGEKTRLRAGQQVVVQLPAGAFLVAPNPEVPIRVIYEDDSIAVLDKPAGLVSEPGIGHKLDTLLNGLIARYGEAQDRIGPEHDYGMVHRLDRDTSGLMVIAKDAEAHRRLSGQFLRREAEKRYTALLAGRLPQQSGEVRLPLGRIRRGGRAVGVAGAGEPQRACPELCRRALTRYRVLERFDDATLVEVHPQTGRWRQIRLHFRALGHPVAGDPDEGDAAAAADDRPKSKKPVFEATCSRCSKKFTVGFKFDPNRPLYCEDCLELVRSGAAKPVRIVATPLPPAQAVAPPQTPTISLSVLKTPPPKSARSPEPRKMPRNDAKQ